MHVEVDLFCPNGFESYYKLMQEKNDWHTAISRKVVGKIVHVTIPKGNMGYNQYTVPNTAAVEVTFVALL